MSASRLIYVMDPMCSWCWGFAPVARALIAQAAAAGVPTHWVMGGLRTGSGAALDAVKRDYILGHWRSVAQTTGQPFDFDKALPQGFVYDTEPACRAVVATRELAADLTPAMVENIQQAFYAQGRDVTLASVLVELAEQAGIARIDFAEAFDDPQLHQATGQDFQWAANLGIAGFPTLLAEHAGQYALLTNGYQPLPQLAPLLQRWLEHLQTGDALPR